MRSTSARRLRRVPPSRSPGSRPAPSSRSRRSQSSKQIEDYVASLELDAYVVGGAVRDALLEIDSKDADFLVPGVDIDGLREALAPHGRTEELIVAGRPVGVRFRPRDAKVRNLARAGIELAPPRREVSTGPGRHAGAAGGREDLERRILRTVSANSFAEDPLRLVRGLRFVSQFDLDPDEHTLQQMRDEAASVRHVSGERIGGGLAADGMGELSKLLMGAHPAKALRLARDTGVLVDLLPEFERSIGFEQESRYHDLSVDEHTFEVVQAAADAGAPLRVRLAALFHDLGKPYVAWRGTDDRLHYYAKRGYSDKSHEQVSAELADRALERLRYPTDLRKRVVRIVRGHMLDPGKADPVRARRLLSRYGVGLTFDLLDHKQADLRGKRGAGHPQPEDDLQRLARFRRVVEKEKSSPHRVRDLAVDGDDLISVGFQPGPKLGRALHSLLDLVIKDPSLNDRETLLAEARRFE